jgi:hypothetical protein
MTIGTAMPANLSTDQQALITEVLGPRCEQFHEQCMTCLAWKMLDELERLTAINRLRFSNDERDRLRDALREIAGYVGPLDYNAEQMRALAREVLNVPGGTSAPGPSSGGETTGVNSPDVGVPHIMAAIERGDGK